MQNKPLKTQRESIQTPHRGVRQPHTQTHILNALLHYKHAGFKRLTLKDKEKATSSPVTAVTDPVPVWNQGLDQFKRQKAWCMYRSDTRVPPGPKLLFSLYLHRRHQESWRGGRLVGENKPPRYMITSLGNRSVTAVSVLSTIGSRRAVRNPS